MIQFAESLIANVCFLDSHPWLYLHDGWKWFRQSELQAMDLWSPGWDHLSDFSPQGDQCLPQTTLLWHSGLKHLQTTDVTFSISPNGTEFQCTSNQWSMNYLAWTGFSSFVCSFCWKTINILEINIILDRAEVTWGHTLQEDRTPSVCKVTDQVTGDRENPTYY